MRLYVCTDHAGFWPVGTASLVVARDEDEARVLLDGALLARKLSPSAEHPYTLREIPLDAPAAHILHDGDD